MANLLDKIIIGKKSFLSSSDLITKDYVTNKWIIKEESFFFYTDLILDRQRGYRGSNIPMSYTQDEEWYIQHTFTLISTIGRHKVFEGYQISGNGRIYPSHVEPGIYYDDVTNNRNLNNKFRPFNNLVRPFRDYSNKNLNDHEKQRLIDRDITFGTRSLTHKVFEGLTYTFGVELETCSGRIEDRDCEGLNLKCEFDGSLRDTPDQRREDVLGGEYITGVLTGDSGMHQLNRICLILAEKCKVNKNCGRTNATL